MQNYVFFANLCNILYNLALIYSRGTIACRNIRNMRQLKITHSITNREDRTLDKYLQDICSVELLTPDEEYVSIFDIVCLAPMGKAKTVVVLKDGETLCLGGLIRKSKSEVRSALPFLGSLPLVGRLFSYTSEEEEENELAIFITPHVEKAGL